MGSDGIALRRQNDPPGSKMPSADRNGVPRHIHPPAVKTPSRDKDTLRRRNLGLLGGGSKSVVF